MTDATLALVLSLMSFSGYLVVRGIARRNRLARRTEDTFDPAGYLD
ncbi:MAG: hypothetical protein ACWA5A_00790 [Marinibacterium sp.]